MDSIIMNQWDKLEYYDPQEILIRLRQLEESFADKEVDEKVRTLRTNKLKTHKEGRDAAILCYGIGETVLKTKVHFARFESSDYDFIARYIKQDTLVYTPVQLKEVVPDRINPNSTLDGEVSKLKRYKSDNLVVGIHMNKKTDQLTLDKIKIPKLKIGGLWIFGSSTIEQSEWFLYGDLLKMPNLYKFNYPGQSPISSNQSIV